MRLVDLAVLYGAVGVACGVLLYRRSERPGRPELISALTAVVLWPLWAPIAWTSRSDPLPTPKDPSADVQRIRTALHEAVESVRGTPLERLLDRDAANTILVEAERISARNRELSLLLAREEFDLAGAEQRVSALDDAGASPRVRASARLQLENVRRLRVLSEADARALTELSALVVALRTELVVTKLSGSSSDSADDIVGDLWAHIEGLRQASEEVGVRSRPAEATLA